MTSNCPFEKLHFNVLVIIVDNFKKIRPLECAYQLARVHGVIKIIDSDVYFLNFKI